MKSLARKLRRESTDAERLLWKYCRNRQLAVFKFRRQFVIKNYIVDFVCLEKKLIIEADGGHHSEQEEVDSKRTELLESLGFKVIRFWNNDILGDVNAVLERIMIVLDKLPLSPPSPQPSPASGRGS